MARSFRKTSAFKWAPNFDVVNSYLRCFLEDFEMPGICIYLEDQNIYKLTEKVPIFYLFVSLFSQDGVLFSETPVDTRERWLQTTFKGSPLRMFGLKFAAWHVLVNSKLDHELRIFDELSEETVRILMILLLLIHCYLY